MTAKFIDLEVEEQRTHLLLSPAFAQAMSGLVIMRVWYSVMWRDFYKPTSYHSNSTYLFIFILSRETYQELPTSTYEFQTTFHSSLYSHYFKDFWGKFTLCRRFNRLSDVSILGSVFERIDGVLLNCFSSKCGI